MKLPKKILVTVIMCTYNGELYVEEQVKSILAQDYPPDKIIVCDDQSQDNTVALLKKIAGATRVPIEIFINQSRLGVVKNFEQAIKQANGDYIFLSDQDDIWLPQKIRITLEKLLFVEKETGTELPILVHTDLYIADCEGQVVANSFMKAQHLVSPTKSPLQTLLVQNFVTGCTVAVNRTLITAALPMPDRVVMHDWWLALIAASTGRIAYVNEPTIYYRQHGGNVIGAKQYVSWQALARVCNIKQLNISIAKSIDQVIMLQMAIASLAFGPVQAVLELYLQTVCTDRWTNIFKVKKLRVHKQGAVRNIIFYVLLFLGGYKKYLQESKKGMR